MGHDIRNHETCLRCRIASFRDRVAMLKVPGGWMHANCGDVWQLAAMLDPGLLTSTPGTKRGDRV